jgi:membrane glycosyltransferase
MKRLTLVLILLAVVYALFLALYTQAIGAPPAVAPPLWYLWASFGAVCLSASAAEFTVFLVWLWQKAIGFSADGGVPLRLTPTQRQMLQQRSPSLALVMPARNEAATEQDRAALARRICDLLVKTPAYSTFFLLVDSPPDQRGNELAVIDLVKTLLRQRGRPEDQSRLVLQEYRDKPELWRHKCGSILRWVQECGRQYEFMFILDADSSLPDEEPHRPRTCDVIERMLLAMMRDRNLALVQAAMLIPAPKTPWAWLQAVNTRMGTAFYLPAFAYVYQRTAPCYGHNCLVRVRDFAQHARNTLYYTSHDHIDAADLAAAGRGCVLSDAVVTCEEPEETVLSWLKRDCRWARGNGQWIVYLLKKRGLPLGPIVFLSLGIAQYLWALMAGMFFIASAALLRGDYQLVADARSLPAVLLIGIVAFTLMAPKMLACPGSYLASAGSLAISLILGPPLLMCLGLAFLLGAFGARWVPRASRSGAFDWRQMLRIAAVLAPIMLLGLALWPAGELAHRSFWGGALVRFMIACLVLSPLSAVLVSRPWALRQAMPASSP